MESLSESMSDDVGIICYLPMKVHFRFGISYHGASQSASGSKDHVAKYREQNKLVFQKISKLQEAAK